MPHIVLTEEQLRILASADVPFEVRDPEGRVLGQILPPAEAEIVEQIKRNRAKNSIRYPAEQVEARLRKLEEIRQREGMTEAKAADLLRRMRAGEEV